MVTMDMPVWARRSDYRKEEWRTADDAIFTNDGHVSFVFVAWNVAPFRIANSPAEILDFDFHPILLNTPLQNRRPVSRGPTGLGVILVGSSGEVSILSSIERRITAKFFPATCIAAVVGCELRIASESKSSRHLFTPSPGKHLSHK